MKIDQQLHGIHRLFIILKEGNIVQVIANKDTEEEGLADIFGHLHLGIMTTALLISSVSGLIAQQFSKFENYCKIRGRC